MYLCKSVCKGTYKKVKSGKGRVEKFDNYNLLNIVDVCRMIVDNQVFLSFCKNNRGFCLHINIKVVPLQAQM